MINDHNYMMLLIVYTLAGPFFVAIDSNISSYREVITFSHLLNEFNQSNQNNHKTMSTSDILQNNVVGSKIQYWVVSVSLPVFTG